jgi:hypothetical protein
VSACGELHDHCSEGALSRKVTGTLPSLRTNEMRFYALRQLGKTAELVAYANGDHSLSRHSRADALDVNRRILEWFERYLKAGSASRTQ